MKLIFHRYDYSNNNLQESEVCHFVLIAGQPLNEPVVQYGMYHEMNDFSTIHPSLNWVYTVCHTTHDVILSPQANEAISCNPSHDYFLKCNQFSIWNHLQ